MLEVGQEGRDWPLYISKRTIFINAMIREQTISPNGLEVDLPEAHRRCPRPPSVYRP